MYQVDSQIVAKKQIAEKYFLITFYNLKIAQSARPGQFVMIKIDNEKTFLRRPFSICSVNKKTFDIVFKVVGCGTKILSQKRIGDSLNIIGPLGNGYPLSTIHYPLSSIFVAGGTGIASLLFLAQSLNPESSSGSITQSLAFIGAKTQKEILFETDLKKLGCKVIVSTEDGTKGYKGLVTNIFALHLPSPISYLPSIVYACGPKEMLKKLTQMCKKKNLKCYVSLEEKMACGLGACMGCVVKTIKNDASLKLKMKNEFEYKLVCKDGPVFDAEKIIWN